LLSDELKHVYEQRLPNTIPCKLELPLSRQLSESASAPSLSQDRSLSLAAKTRLYGGHPRAQDAMSGSVMRRSLNGLTMQKLEVFEDRLAQQMEAYPSTGLQRRVETLGTLSAPQSEFGAAAASFGSAFDLPSVADQDRKNAASSRVQQKLEFLLGDSGVKKTRLAQNKSKFKKGVRKIVSLSQWKAGFGKRSTQRMKIRLDPYKDKKLAHALSEVRRSRHGKTYLKAPPEEATSGSKKKLNMNPFGPNYTPADVKFLSAVFHKLDANDDGAVCLQEWRDSIEKRRRNSLAGTTLDGNSVDGSQNNMDLGMNENFFQIIDRDCSGDVSVSEFVAAVFPKANRNMKKLIEQVVNLTRPCKYKEVAISALSLESKKEIESMFRTFDKDRDGKVTFEEICEIITLDSVGIQSLLSEEDIKNIVFLADKDGSHQLDLAEFVSMITEP